ncbi:DUF2461 domain-containing protein [Rhizosphaericola mali]|uniref:DUF2461 domain-containing protein n=1 Tax=Rhizosphaericola mali TaxID=2545455 RepID=A0A5P2G7D6_9BACT|nr:DUF2461 domain-containing protein [Rhizosphaericola mali]QES90608.1 DUF2461 domain-containing protein [Rhizosphaericola mali]
MKKSSLHFLSSLEKNNHKEWFDANKTDYQDAKEDLILTVSDILRQFQQKDTTLAQVEAQKTLFRINRDVRFSKNKAPYKTNLGASINASGRTGNLAGYYLHIQPGGNSFCGGGLWNPEPEALAKVRQEIDYNLEEFEAIVENKDFKKQFGGLERAEEFLLKREPKGYTKDNPAIEFLKFKCFIGSHHLTDKMVQSEALVSEILQSFEAIFPLIQFLNRAILD